MNQQKSIIQRKRHDLGMTAKDGIPSPFKDFDRSLERNFGATQGPQAKDQQENLDYQDEKSFQEVFVKRKRK